MNVKCENGKYEWCFDEKTAKLTCKRYGQDWRDESGDGAIYALLYIAYEMQGRLQGLEK